MTIDQATINDVLSKVSRKLLWQECVWASDETQATKIYLLCVGRFFNENGNASSMAGAQIERECSMSKAERKRCGQRSKNKWLDVVAFGGFRHGRGNANLYHAMIPNHLIPVACEAILGRLQGVDKKGLHQSPIKGRGLHQDPVQDYGNQERKVNGRKVGSSGRVRGVAATQPTNVVSLNTWRRAIGGAA